MEAGMEVKVWRLVWRGVQVHMLHTITKQYGGWYGTSILEPEQALSQWITVLSY
jgi:hypothetical protein